MIRDGDRVRVVPVIHNGHLRNAGQADVGTGILFQGSPILALDPKIQQGLVVLRRGALAFLVVVVHPIERLLFKVSGIMPAFHAHYRIRIDHRHQGQAQHQCQQAAEQAPAAFFRHASLPGHFSLLQSFAFVQHESSPLPKTFHRGGAPATASASAFSGGICRQPPFSHPTVRCSASSSCSWACSASDSTSARICSCVA